MQKMFCAPALEHLQSLTNQYFFIKSSSTTIIAKMFLSKTLVLIAVLSTSYSIPIPSEYGGVKGKYLNINSIYGR